MCCGALVAEYNVAFCMLTCIKSEVPFQCINMTDASRSESLNALRDEWFSNLEKKLFKFDKVRRLVKRLDTLKSLSVCSMLICKDLLKISKFSER